MFEDGESVKFVTGREVYKEFVVAEFGVVEHVGVLELAGRKKTHSQMSTEKTTFQ